MPANQLVQHRAIMNRAIAVLAETILDPAVVQIVQERKQRVLCVIIGRAL
jgi:hypothetical protein